MLFKRILEQLSGYRRFKKEAKEAVKTYYGLSCEAEHIDVIREPCDGSYSYYYYIPSPIFGKDIWKLVEDEKVKEAIGRYIDALNCLLGVCCAVFVLAFVCFFVWL